MLKLTFQGFLFFIILLLCFSCQLFISKKNEQAVARVGESYLYKDDIRQLLPKKYTKEDSIKIVTNFINNWATKELLMTNAQRNIPKDKQKEFAKLVEDYKKDLYGRYYKDKILSKSIDTVITSKERDSFYHQNKVIFKLNEDLLKLRYIQFSSEQGPEVVNLEDKFKRFNKKDQKELDSLSLHFPSSYFNDTVWVRSHNVYGKLPFLEGKDLKAGQFFEHKDSTGFYLVKINDYLARTKQAPIEYVMPILTEIILNQRKIENARKFEKELIQSAIKKKQFEIYE